ncbi:ccr4 associated factor [Sporothrix bragantina]|uniref:Iron-sulfur cluster assembly factor IBA57 homolog, mitochondrial n=1 Tax=Sporothrix bragantina TaxID=671064 RepID=A0ABP0CT73_9PEZI
MNSPWLAVPRGMQRAVATSWPTSVSALRSMSASFPSSSSSPVVICRSCRRSRGLVGPTRRAYSSSAAAVSSQLPSSGAAALASRRIISVSGPDAAKYLQGVITSSILRLQTSPDMGAETTTPPSGLYSAFLSAQGRVLHDVFVYRDTLGIGKDADANTNSFLVEVDADAAVMLTKHIKRYKLRAKFDVRLLEAGELTVWHGWGDYGVPSAGDGIIAHHDTRAPGLGWRFVAPATSLPQQVELDVADESAYRLHRYLLGVAEGQREILFNQALPLESNMDIMGGIDYHKGCYVGQELTIRTRHRGVVRKRILPCIVYGEGEAAPDSLAAAAATASEGDLASTISAETNINRVGKKGRSAGKWLSGVGNLGLALCRLETMTDIVLPGEAAAATITFNPASEFMMNVADPSAAIEGEAGEAGAEAKPSAPTTPVKIKAFVPDWLRQGLAPPEAK